MSPIKCPACEYRNSHTAEICINCGAALPLQAPVVETQRLDPAQMREHLAPKNRPAPSMPNTKPIARSEAQQLHSAQAREHLAPKNRPAPNEERLPRQKPTPPQETQRLHPAQAREHLAPKNKPIPNEERLPRQKPTPPQGTQRLHPAQAREHLAPKNKPIPNEERLPRQKPASPQGTQRLHSAQAREHLAPKSKPAPNQEHLPRQKPAPPQGTQRLHSAQAREHLAPKSKPAPNQERTSNTKPIHREQHISKNRHPSKAETIGAYSEAKAEILSPEAEVYPETKAADPYLTIEPYSEEEAYTNETYSSKEIVPYRRNQPESAALVPSMNTALEPYRISSMIEQIQPQGILPTLPTLVKEEKDPEPWLTDKLPWGFPRRPPDVAGTIILITQSQELPDYPNVILGLVNMLTELIWMIPNDTMKKEEERLQITIARIRTTSTEDKKAELKDVRLIGYLRGANLTLGDTIWFWGWHRKGSLLVRKGYNWTSKAIVETHSMGLILPALVVLILLGIAFLIFLVWPSVSAGLSTLFLMAPHKP